VFGLVNSADRRGGRGVLGGMAKGGGQNEVLEQKYDARETIFAG
jgi:hypothetical protein